MTTQTLVQTIRHATRRATWFIRAASVLFITALTAAAAQISVPLPFTAVPFTFQPMIVLLGGLALGSQAGRDQPGAVSRRRASPACRSSPHPSRCRPARCACSDRPVAT